MPSSNTCKLGSLVTIFLHRYRATSSSSGGYSPSYPGLKHAVQLCRLGGDHGRFVYQRQRFFSCSNVMVFRKHKIDINEKNKGELQSAAPALPRPNIATWIKWFVGTIFSLLLPLFKQRWDNLLLLEGKLENAAEEIEHVSEVVEKVAIRTEKMSAEVANKLPGDCKLKEAALIVEHISNVAAHDAQLAENIIHKANDLKEDVEELEKMVEPIIDGIAQVKRG